MKKVLAIMLAATLCLSLSAQPKRLTVKEFLKLSPKDTASYIVSGVVSKIRSSSSGSFYLKDRTGTMLVYGIQDPSDPSASIKKMGIMRGDTVAVQGRFLLYAGQTKEMKDGILLSKADGPEHGKTFLERLDRQPSFQGHEGNDAPKAFSKWVNEHVKRPANGEKGTVVVDYAIGRNGKVQEVQVKSGASPALDAEAVRVVKSAPKWKPAKYDGVPVRVMAYVTVVFD
ncbi:MAG: energy transducer TonB [Bacteroidales bacterium]|nr:energy transducer TonB [Bacteroidales bacterium]